MLQWRRLDVLIVMIFVLGSKQISFTHGYIRTFHKVIDNVQSNKQTSSTIQSIYLPVVFKKPFKEFSYYIASTEKLYELGQKRGKFYSHSREISEGIVILAFGAADGNDRVLIYDYMTFLTPNDIKQHVQNYVRGFYGELGMSDAILTVVVGVNSSRSLSQNHGSNWGLMINDLNSWAGQYGYSGQVRIVGGIDAETNWRSPSESREWANGYSLTSYYRAYNFGTASGCPLDLPSTEPQYQNPTPQTCPTVQGPTPAWTQDDVYYVSWMGDMWPLPEIYNTVGANADQWYRIGLYSKLKYNNTMHFYGSLTQFYACEQQRDPITKQLPADCIGTNNYPSVGYAQLLDRLQSDPYNRIAYPMIFMTDIYGITGIQWKKIPSTEIFSC
ncbi:MAG: hypothetical protein AB1894_27885 [Chloroflexota bacterium]